MTASTSRPARIVSMISAWPSRKEAKPNTLRSRFWAAMRSAMGDSAFGWSSGFSLANEKPTPAWKYPCTYPCRKRMAMVSSGRRFAYASWPFTREPPDAAPVFSRPVAGRLVPAVVPAVARRRGRAGHDPSGPARHSADPRRPPFVGNPGRAADRAAARPVRRGRGSGLAAGGAHRDAPHDADRPGAHGARLGRPGGGPPFV